LNKAPLFWKKLSQEQAIFRISIGEEIKMRLWREPCFLSQQFDKENDLQKIENFTFRVSS